MSYFSDHYHSYVPPFISGTEEVRMSIMKVTNMTEMEQRIKMRHAFAMSSFARMFTPNKITYDTKSSVFEITVISDSTMLRDQTSTSK